MQWLKSTLLPISLLTTSVTLLTLSSTVYASEQNDSSENVTLWEGDSSTPDAKRQEHIAQAIQAHKASLLHSDSPSVGPKDAKVTIVAFFDYQCSYCKTMEPILERLQRENPSIKIIYKPIPILGNNSNHAAKAALASQKQGKYSAMHEELIASQDLSKNAISKMAEHISLNPEKFQADLNSKEIDQKIENNLNLAKDLSIKTIPVTLMMNNNTPSAVFIVGNTDLESLQNLVNKLEKS